ncbi:MAG: SDR family NAD(P)-dependent oxidoreductase [Thermoplasmata archaeon]
MDPRLVERPRRSKGPTLERLRGKNALVTGASRGLGAEIARAFAAEGARVGLVQRRASAEANAVHDGITARNGASDLFSADVGDPAQVAELFRELDARWGRLDILVNNAGVTGRTPQGIDRLAWDEVMDTNARGAYLMTQAAAPRFARNPRGKVLFVASDVVITGSARSPPYAASKYALLGLTKSYALQLAPHVQVNAIAPGFMDTPAILARPDMTPEKIAQIKQATPLGDFTHPAEVAKLAVFLCSDDAAFITGEAVLINGGRVLW